MKQKILTQAQIKQRIKKVKKTEGMISLSALADVYHTFVLRRYKKFREHQKTHPEELDKKRVQYCHERVRFYVKELEKLVKVAKKMRDLERKSKKNKIIATKIGKQADEAEKICKLYGKDVRKLF